jgi:hypothetical protein
MRVPNSLRSRRLNQLAAMSMTASAKTRGASWPMPRCGCLLTKQAKGIAVATAPFRRCAQEAAAMMIDAKRKFKKRA